MYFEAFLCIFWIERGRWEKPRRTSRTLVRTSETTINVGSHSSFNLPFAGVQVIVPLPLPSSLCSLLYKRSGLLPVQHV